MDWLREFITRQVRQPDEWVWCGELRGYKRDSLNRCASSGFAHGS